MSQLELSDTEVRAKVFENGTITLGKKFRDKFGIEADDEVILEFKGKVTKTEKVIKPKNIK